MEDMNGKNIFGLILDWNYKEEYANVSMPGYIAKKVKKYQHSLTSKPQYVPHKWLKSVYGKELQYAPPPDEMEKIEKAEAKRIQSIFRSFLYNARAVNPTILPAWMKFQHNKQRRH